MLVLLIVKQMAVLALVLAAAAGAGTLALGTREGLALRGALGLALCAHACFFLGLIGLLRPLPIMILLVVAIVGGAVRMRAMPAIDLRAAVFLIPLFLLALYPPTAFDETLYHLPFVRAFAHDGVLRFLPDLRFPVFPVLHELLSVPVFLLAGDTATHLVALAELIVITALLIEWGGGRAGWLAAAMFIGSPLVVQLATTTYVDIALTLFIVAGFYALTRERYVLAGIFLGSACSVKYLGAYFAVFALLLAARRLRYALACAMTALPMTAWIFLNTHNPVFPFMGSSAWALDVLPSISLTERAIFIVCIIWDATFDRARIGLQPPVTPFLALIVVLVLVAAIRNVQARWLVLLSAGYVVAFSFLPPDSRYLVPLLALLSMGASLVVAQKWPRAVIPLALIAIAPGIAYAGYRLMRQGLPPSTPQQRHEWLATRVPEYRALRLAGTDRVYGCHAAQLKSYADGEYLGDYNGPYSYDHILQGATSTRILAERMRRIDARYFLLSKRACAPLVVDGGMELVYEDANAQLWRVGGGGAGGRIGG